jgi:hypothetical protein
MMGTLRAGAAELDITPPLGCHLVGYFQDRIAEDIHDELHVRALALDNGQCTLGLIVCDLIDLPVRVVEGAKARIEEVTGVAPGQVLISCTHTHTGPSAVGALGTPDEPEYAAWLIPRIADAFVLAHRRLRPVQAARLSGACPEEVHNRRWHMRDGSVRMNPGYENPDAVRPAGPTDPELGVLVLRDAESGAPVGLYANLALHYVGSRDGLAVSADYFGEYTRAIQRIAGAAFVPIISNGCQGNINNCDFTRPAREAPTPYHQIERVANVVAAETWKQWCLLRESDWADDVSLGATLIRVPFNARMPKPDELAAARKLYESEENSTDAEWLYARELVLMTEQPSQWEIPLQAMHVGDLGIVGLHGEVFVEVGLDIKARSPFAQTLVVGLANGSAGYVATDQALTEGSYETRLCRHVRAPAGSAQLWADTAVKALDSLRP